MKKPSSAQKRAFRDMTLAFLCAVLFFSSIFTQETPFYVAFGVAMLSLAGFLVLFNRGYAFWEESKGPTVGPRA